MSFINWGSHYSVGIPVMDGQHKRMADLLNQFHADVRAGAEFARLRLVLDALVQASLDHFKEEEALMEGIQFPGLERHKQEHSALAEKIAEFSNGFTEEEKVVPTEVQAFFRGWFLDHVQKHDRDYGVFLYNQRTRRRAESNKEKAKEPVA